jgi:hypothetical protein
MKKFKDLIIQSGQSQTLKDILQSVISGLPSNWKFREDLVMEYAKNVSKSKDEIGCFESPTINSKNGFVWFVIWENELKVVNIVPTVSGSLTHDEYNEILESFNTDCVSKSLVNKDVNFQITEGVYNIQEVAGKKTYEALNKWEKLCNHSTGNTNSYDFERWADFLSIAFKEKSKLTPDLLNRWLVEERNWHDDDLVTELVLDYEYGLSILEHYVKNY